MIKGLTEDEKYKLIRPIIGGCEYDSNMIPIVRKSNIDNVAWDRLNVRGIQNISSKTYNKDTLLLMFAYDKKLQPLWNEPLKKIGVFQSYAAITTPDYSVYSSMNINDIRYNVYRSRWLGRTWQNYGCNVWPTIGWALPDTYDICFGNVEKGSIVVVSTLGCRDNPDVFLEGYYEMKARICPPVIVVFGDLIEGMTGTIVNFRYKEAFCTHHEQLRLKEVPRIVTLEEVV